MPRNLGKGLTFDDVSLVPQYNNVESRLNPSTTTKLARDIEIGIPIVNSPMSSVINCNLATILWDFESVPIFHRFYKIEDDLWKDLEGYGGPAVLSMGTNREDDIFSFAAIKDIIAGYGGHIRGICIDVSHGHASYVERTIKTIKDFYGETGPQIIAGNVCSARGTHDLIHWGADSIRVGIGPGSACITRMVTGFGTPQFSALVECAEEAKRHKVPIIADGGIRNSRDIMLALAAGASCVFIGRLLAGTLESAGERHPHNTHVKYAGQASSEFQRTGMAPEGVEAAVRVTGPAGKLLENLVSNIKTALTYGGAKSIPEFQDKAEYVEVTSSYINESKARDWDHPHAHDHWKY